MQGPEKWNGQSDQNYVRRAALGGFLGSVWLHPYGPGALATVTFEGRKSRSWIEYPFCSSSTTVPSGNSAVATCATASCFSGSNFSAFDENRKQCLEAGMNGFLTKPLIMISLKEEIERHLRIYADRE